jgi:hypothetical protein
MGGSSEQNIMSKVFVLGNKKTVPNMENQRFVNCSTVPLVVCAGAQNYSRDVSQLTLHSSHHQTEYSFGGGLLEV